MSNVYETQQPLVENSRPIGSYGYLLISVAAAGRAIPIENAMVSVFGALEESSGDLLAVQITNANGQTDTISLAAPLADNSLNPDRENPYNSFFVRIVAADFITRDKVPVQIFPGVKSRLVINMQTSA